MLNKFKCHNEAVELYKCCKKIKLRAFLKDQLLRASSSVALNLGEGSGRRTQKDRLRHYNIAFASLREVQSICELEDLNDIAKMADQLAAMLFVLNRNLTDAAHRPRG